MASLRRGTLALTLTAFIVGCGDSGQKTEMNTGTAQEGMDAAKSGLSAPTDPMKTSTSPAGKGDAKK